MQFEFPIAARPSALLARSPVALRSSFARSRRFRSGFIRGWRIRRDALNGRREKRQQSLHGDWFGRSNGLTARNVSGRYQTIGHVDHRLAVGFENDLWCERGPGDDVDAAAVHLESEGLPVEPELGGKR